MLSYLKGTIKVKTERSVIIEVNSVGYEVFVSPLFLEKAKRDETVELYTHQHVREDLIELYGFDKIDELNFFKQIISVSGIGPKSGLTILSLAPMAELKKGIIEGDASLLTKVSGIGNKTAERLILELRNKLEDSGTEGIAGASGASDSQSIDGLMALGYTAREAREALRQVDKNVINVKDRVKGALKMIGKER